MDCIVPICSGMGATNLIFKVRTEFRSVIMAVLGMAFSYGMIMDYCHFIRDPCPLALDSTKVCGT